MGKGLDIKKVTLAKDLRMVVVFQQKLKPALDKAASVLEVLTDIDEKSFKEIEESGKTKELIAVACLAINDTLEAYMDAEDQFMEIAA